MEQVVFYLHPYFWPKGPIPHNMEAPWLGFDFGIYTWTIQTFLRLKAAGFPVTLTSTLPEQGIVISHRECLAAVDGYFPEKVIPGPDLFIVDICADLPPYPNANFHLVQNKWQEQLGDNFRYVPHWPQPCIKPRDPALGERFQNVGYFGQDKYLPKELLTPEWHHTLEKMGLKWISHYRVFFHHKPETYGYDEHWSDYSDLDAIIAVRNGNGKSPFNHKPPSKLFNAWLSGIPAILGKESAYRFEGNPGVDYLEAGSIDEIYRHLERLQADTQLRKELVDKGKMQAARITPEEIARYWIRLITEEIVPAFRKWQTKTAFKQQIEIKARRANIWKNKIMLYADRKL